MSKTETYRYLVDTDLSDSPVKIDAAYYAHEDEFTIFKAESGSIVASFANRHIVSIEREQVASTGSPSLVGAISVPVGATTTNLRQHPRHDGLASGW